MAHDAIKIVEKGDFLDADNIELADFLVNIRTPEKLGGRSSMNRNSAIELGKMPTQQKTEV